MLNILLWTALLAANATAAPPEDPRLPALLQDFANSGAGTRFSELGDENDFDHGHLLRDARTGTLVAILYHTRELAVPAPAERSWIQWLDGRGVESAARYERTSYPSSAEWDWFVARDLPRLKSRNTVVERMLDPARLGVEVAPGPQWTFTRAGCGAPGLLTISLPGRAPVCLKTELL